MSSNWFIAESNYTNADVKGVGFYSWEREGGRKKGWRERGSNKEEGGGKSPLLLVSDQFSSAAHETKPKLSSHS